MAQPSVISAFFTYQRRVLALSSTASLVKGMLALSSTAALVKGMLALSSTASLVKGRGTAERWRDSFPRQTLFRANID